MEKRPHTVTGKIFSIATQRTRTGTTLRLEVNFPQDIVQLSKEVNSLIILLNAQACVCACMKTNASYCSKLLCICDDIRCLCFLGS